MNLFCVAEHGFVSLKKKLFGWLFLSSVGGVFREDGVRNTGSLGTYTH